MRQTVSIDTKTLQYVVSQLDKLTRDMAELKEKLLGQEPEYGSDEWWEWSDKKSIEDIKRGNVISFNSIKEMQKHLDSLK